MSISSTIQKKINELEGLVKKHELEIIQHNHNRNQLLIDRENMENELKRELSDNNIYKSQYYKKIWGDLKVDKSMARNTIYMNVYAKPIKYQDNKIAIEDMLIQMFT